jgi:hypothetical protein
VITGWAEFLRWIERRAGAGERDRAGTWLEFTKLAEQSERASSLRLLTKCGVVLPESERQGLVVAVARLLAPLERPVPARACRTAVAAALGALVRETDPDSGDSFFAIEMQSLEMDENGRDTLRLTHVLLFAAHEFFHGPCRRNDLPTVAHMCNWGYSMTVRIPKLPVRSTMRWARYCSRGFMRRLRRDFRCKLRVLH